MVLITIATVLGFTTLCSATFVVSMDTLISYKHAKICQSVYRGCIVINNTPICYGQADTPVVDSGSATFYAMFSGSNDGEYALSGCTMEATWPSYYGDIYFAADNCLYDAQCKSL